jgi:hypothetical protein
MILIIISDTDHDLNLYLELNSWIQIMILKHALRASFVDPFLSLITNPFWYSYNTSFYLSNSDLYSLRFGMLLSCCADSLGWTKSLRLYCTITNY